MTEVAERLHDVAAEAGAGREILWDDRDESPGVKFTDAELLGMPWILTVSPALARGRRGGGDRTRDRCARDPAARGGRGIPPGRRREPGPGRGPRVAFRGMAPRLLLPADDLYARLEVPPDATPEAIEIAWRALLRRHHPDVAGPDGLATATAINVAHDWLSDPELRVRYDRERGIRTGRRGRAAGWDDLGGPARSTARTRPSARRAPPDRGAALAAFLDRVTRLSADELDRLDCAAATPIAFVASIERFLSKEQRAAVATVEAELRARLPESSWQRPHVRDAVLGAALEHVLGEFLDEHLDEPFRGRVHERLDTGLGRGGRPATLRAGRGRR